MVYIRYFFLFNLPWLLLFILNFSFFHLTLKEFSALNFWYYFVTILGYLFFPVIQSAFPKLRDGAFGLSKLGALLVLLYFNWIGASTGIMSFSSASLSFSLLLFAFGISLFSKNHKELGDLFVEYRDHIFRSEFVFFFLFVFFLTIFSMNPEMYWGEKPMDFSIFNFSLRTSEIPLFDPWFAGEKMKYYYWGYTFFAGIAKMTGVEGEVGYALSLATISGLFGSCLYTLMNFLVRKKNLAMGSALLITLGSNYRAFSGLIFEGERLDIRYFWANTRVFMRGEFAEYPSWSLLFSDLHPHVMSYPFVIFNLVCLFYGLRYVWGRFKFGEHRSFFFITSLVFGSLIGVNGWDFIIYTFFNGIIFLLNFETIKKPKVWGLFFLVHAIGLILFFPMALTLSGGVPTKWGPWLSESNSLLSHFHHHGLWWIITLSMFAPLLILKRASIRWKVVLNSFGFRIAFATVLLSIFAENMVFMDRINTVFKAFTNIYIWWGILACIGLRYFKFYIRKLPLLPFAFTAMLVLSFSLMGTFFNIKSLTGNRLFGKQSFGLKGSRFMQKVNPGDFAVISWIRDHVKGTPFLVERYSKSFDHSAARISMHTGVPTYLGWDNHVHLRGRKWSEINERKRDIDYIFNSNDPLKVYEFMQKKHLNFLVVGNLERKYYSSKGLDKFKQYKDIFKPLITNGRTTLYGVGKFENFLDSYEQN